MSSGNEQACSIVSLVNETIGVPTLPEVLVKLNRIIVNPKSSASDVAKVIAADPAVATNILRTVNSAYYGLQVRVSSIALAVSIMGFVKAKQVALRAAVFSMFEGAQKDQSPFFEPAEFWKHSVYTGIAARVLGTHSPVFASTDPEDLYIAGLLHDIGQLILLERRDAGYSRVLSRTASSGMTLVEMEQEMLGYTHADVGSVLAIKWFLPEVLRSAIRYHHSPSRDPGDRALSSLIHLADRVAWDAGRASTKGLPAPELDPMAYVAVGLDEEQVAQLAPRAEAEFAGIEMPW